MKTIGISPKTTLAFFYPAISSVITAVGSWIVTGNFNDSELRVALAGLGASAIAALGAYIGKPGRTVPDSQVTVQGPPH